MGSPIGLEFGTEKFYRFGIGFGFNFVVTTGSGSICYAGRVGFVKVHGFGFRFGFKLPDRLGRFSDFTLVIM